MPRKSVDFGRREPLQERKQQQRAVLSDEAKAAALAIDNVFSEIKNNLGRRGRLNAALSALSKQILHFLEITNQESPKELVPVLSDLLKAHSGALLDVHKRLGGGERNAARVQLLALAENLNTQLLRPTVQAYDPLDMKSLAESTARAFSAQKVWRLNELQPFEGSGVYAIYYSGAFPLYEPIAEQNKIEPGSKAIYVGEAGRDKRKGVRAGRADMEKTIFARLEDHKASIGYATNIEVNDFSCRYLAIEDLFIPLCESILIETHRPLWNMKVDGFGNKHVGESRRATQQMTIWDLLHPGRPNRATVDRRDRCKTFDDVAALVKEFFDSERIRIAKMAEGIPSRAVDVAEMAEAPEAMVKSAAERASTTG
jgi:hypothetical protein